MSTRRGHTRSAPLTILMLSYQRRHNVAAILESVRAQHWQPSVFLWDNGAANPSTRVSLSPTHAKLVAWQVSSMRNVGCWPRWIMAESASTEYVCSLDDDLAFADSHAMEAILDSMTSQRPDSAVGYEGVVLHSGRPYYVPGQNRNYHLRSGTRNRRVDIVKGRFLAIRRAALTKVRVDPNEREDDIALSGQLAGGRCRHHLVPAGLAGIFRELPTGQTGNFDCAGHLASRERARRRFFDW
jgi:hypothetical protein